MTVANVPPVADQLVLSTTSVMEDGKVLVVLTGHVSDIGTLDTVAKLDIDWGDGTKVVSMTSANFADRVVYDPVTRTFTASHRYLDDTPPGTPRDILTIKVTATDDDTCARTSTIPIEVINIAPKVTVHIDDPELYAATSFILKGTIDDPGVLDIETIRINWGEGLSDVVVLKPDQRSDVVVLKPDQRTFAIAHTYREPYLGHYVISVEVMDKDTGVGKTELGVVVHIPGSPDAARQQSVLEGQLGTAPMAPIPDAPFRSTVFNSPEILWGGIKFGLLVAEKGTPIKLALNLDELGGANVSKVEIDWGDGNKQTVDNPANRSFDVAHAYSHIVGDDEIATGSLSTSDRNGRDQGEVIIKTFRKGADGRDELASITRYRLEETGNAPRVDKFRFDRSSTADGEVDTVNGRVSYPGLPDTALLQIKWSDGTTSTGSIEEKDGAFWFSASHVYSGKAPLDRIGLRFINVATLKGIGSFEISPLSAASLSPAPAQQPSPDQRRGDAAPAGHEKAASHAAVNDPLKTSDMALIFGAGLVANQANGPASFRLDQLLERTIRRKRTTNGEKPRDRTHDWLAAPYRVSDETKAVAETGAWRAVDDDWLITPNRNAAPPLRRGVADGDADWMMIGR